MIFDNPEKYLKIAQDWVNSKYPTFLQLKDEWKSISSESDKVSYRNPPHFLQITQSDAEYLYKEEGKNRLKLYSLDDHIPEEVAKIFGIAEVLR